MVSIDIILYSDIVLLQSTVEISFHKKGTVRKRRLQNFTIPDVSTDHAEWAITRKSNRTR